MSTKEDVEQYDLVILGGGTGGTIAAWTFAAEGQRVAVIDRKYIGGSCPNIACLPSKNVIHSAKAVWLVHPTKGLGAVTGSMRADDDLFRGLFFPTNRNLI